LRGEETALPARVNVTRARRGSVLYRPERW
jgi:hypothetical protein